MVTKAAPPPAPVKKPNRTPATPTPTPANPAPATATQGPSKETTEVTKWLKDNSAAEFVDAFYIKGFYYIKDITHDDLKNLFRMKKVGHVQKQSSCL